jgi:hypothetical protein
MRFARRVFLGAGVYGLLVLLPFFFLERRIGRDHPPAMAHPEYFYGFVGVAVAWQLAFLTIGTDPARYRPLMLAAMVEKFSFVVAVAALWANGRVAGPILGGAAGDLVLGVLFVAAYLRTRAPS